MRAVHISMSKTSFEQETPCHERGLGRACRQVHLGQSLLIELNLASCYLHLLFVQNVVSTRLFLEYFTHILHRCLLWKDTFRTSIVRS